MRFQSIEGKTIKAVTLMKRHGYDDRGWMQLDFTDGTKCVIVASYGGYTGRSIDEYPVQIGITEDTEDLEPVQFPFDEEAQRKEIWLRQNADLVSDIEDRCPATPDEIFEYFNGGARSFNRDQALIKRAIAALRNNGISHEQVLLFIEEISKK